MKVLYIGHYKERGGWSRVATDNILAMESVGIDVVCRNVTLTRDNPCNDKLLKLEKKNTKGCDHCVQHVLPHHLVGTNAFKKNVAFLESETTSIKGLGWLEHLQQMDEVFVANNQLAASLQADGLSPKIRVVPHTCNIENYTQKYPDINVPQANGKFKFYYIGDLNDRKNIESIIRCFHSEFDKSEPTILILKVKKFGMSEQHVRTYVDKILSSVKSSLRLYKTLEEYKKDIVISEDLSEEHIYSLHQYADCFICPSHGEAWSIPSFDAMAFGKTPICSDFGGPPDFIRQDDPATGECVPGVYSVCQCSDSAFPDMFTGREYWFTPCEKSIREQMRYYYENRNPTEYKIRGLQQAKKFSYEKVGQRIKELLSE